MTAHFVTLRPSSDPANRSSLDRYRWFKQQGSRLDGWSASRAFSPGDLAVYYFATPVRSIVAVGIVDSDPYYEEVSDPADFSNPVFCDIRPLWQLQTPLASEAIKANAQLRGWWSTRPYRSIRRIEDSVATSLVDELSAANPDLPAKLKRHGWPMPRPRGEAITEVPTKPTAMRGKKRQTWSMDHLLAYSWLGFEELVAEAFHLKHGYVVEETPPQGDMGVDAFLRPKGKRCRDVLQCKHYRPSVKVSSPDIQRFLGAIHKFGAAKGFFVTTSGFTRWAEDYARGTEIELIDGEALVAMLNTIDALSPAKPPR